MSRADGLEPLEPGTLWRPGPIGRGVRLLLGILCLYALWQIGAHAPTTNAQPLATLGNRALLLLGPLCVFNYVVNIGYSKSWGRWPLAVSLFALTSAGAVSLLLTGSPDSPVLGIPLNLWFGYFYAHLGLSFVLAAVLATPGCEMRSIPELLGRLRGTPAPEYDCPVAFITRIDQWERDRAAG